MSFGLSGDESNSVMVGGDVAVAWVDKQTLKGASDRFDHQIFTNKSQPIIWAIGPLNQRDEVSFHSSYLKKDSFINFGRPAKWNCPMPETEQPPMVPIQQTRIAAEEEEDIPVVLTTSAPRKNTNRRRGGNRRPQTPQENVDDSEKSATKTQQQRRRGAQRESGTAVRAVPSPALVQKRDAWDIPAIQCYEPEDGVFYAQMGPTGGKRGGKSYTFVVEGGLDPEVSAKYHPFYITDDPVGGYEYKTPEEKKDIKIFAGVREGKDGSVAPTGTGRLCHWTQTGDLEADDFESFGAYQRTLELKCDQGEPGVIQWTPDRNTPDTVYYQCFTHRYLGWKINVHDSCDEQPAASEVKPIAVVAPDDFLDKSDIDLEESPSVRIETRVNPNNLITEGKEDKEFKSAVSEKKNIAPTIDPLPTTGQPQEKFSNEPILIHAQQNFFDPFYPRNRPFFAQHTYNPNLFEQQHHHYFRPSTPLKTVHENATPHYTREITAIFPTTPSTTTTTATTSTTAISTTTQDKPRIVEDIVVGASYRPNETYLLPPLVNSPPTFNMGFRRPLGPPPGFLMRPLQSPMKMILRQPNLSPIRQFFPQQMTFKKQINRSPMKMPMPNKRPYNFQLDNKPMFFSHVPPKRQAPPPFYISQPAPVITRAPPIQNQKINIVVTETSKIEDVRNVEISPQQLSTEREPEIQTAPSTSIMDITPTFIRHAYNTGFKPGSVKIESGFKPIISKEFQDRMDRNEPDIEYESEMGVVDIDNADKYEFKPIQSFEPIKDFYQKKRHSYTKIVMKQPRSLIESEDEPIAEAAERVETYYLPPSDNRAKPIDIVRKPSNIDIEEPDSTSLNIDSPPDVVVTYDGKKVSGQSLTAKLSDRSSILDQRVSKASEFIKAMPQFGKFKGELPPLNPEFIERNAPQLQSRAGVLNRDLDTPSLPSSASLYLPQGITRLSRVRKSYKDGGTRRKRAAHHTPEHISLQEQETATAIEKTVVTVKQDDFLSNGNNKLKLISFLIIALTSHGVQTEQASSDADTLIVRTALMKSFTCDKVAIVGEDVDLLVLLMAVTPAEQNILLVKPSHGKVARKVYSSQQLQTLGMKDSILLVHAFSGCDTTSAAYRKGKLSCFKLFKKQAVLQGIADIFNSPNHSVQITNTEHLVHKGQSNVLAGTRSQAASVEAGQDNQIAGPSTKKRFRAD
ncbi:hypothetical protein NQ314_013908 [Rhamnusium bicolor]|uniref:At5g54830-like domain-containing protein n=1 Tax=Rhamnusium bicolor TaxID=1586634 RepID=A0AAV8X4S5_9CUCU|nr:hypothetical protein NQ314_013908 [Rhamnusium bicolor]